MYGLPQPGKITNEKLKLYLAKFGYEREPITPSLWQNQTHTFQCSLVVDDFGIKHECQEDTIHILDELKTISKISEDWDGKLYCVLNLEWDYYKREVLVSMPNYVTKALHKFQNPNPKRAQYEPHQWKRQNYNAKTASNSLGYFTANTIVTKAQDPTSCWNIPLICP